MERAITTLVEMKLPSVTRLRLFYCSESSCGLGIMPGNKLLNTFVVWDKVLTGMRVLHSTRADFNGIEYRPADFCDILITFL